MKALFKLKEHLVIDFLKSKTYEEINIMFNCIAIYDKEAPLEEKGRYFEIIQKDVIDLLNNMITPILPNMIPMRDITQISEGDKLFYELGYKKNSMGGYGDNWIREGIFKEIKDIKRFLKDDKMISDIEYLNHHNFMLIKSK